jgi:hypothetical protein
MTELLHTDESRYLQKEGTSHAVLTDANGARQDRRSNVHLREISNVIDAQTHYPEEFV